MKKKGLTDTTMGPVLAIVLLAGFAILALTVVKPMIFGASEAQEGCSYLAGVISNVAEGAVSTC